MNVQTIDLDLDKQTDIIPTVRIAQGDKRGTTIRANVYDSGPANLSGLTAQFEMRLPESKQYYSTPATISGSTVQAVIDESYAGYIPGLTPNAYFVFKQGDTIICSTSRFNIEILPSAKEGAVPGDRWSNEIDAAVEAANNAASNANSKASAANSAASAANSAASAANSAANAANSAASNANSKASDANTAAANANDKAAAANTAANSANSAATAANSAANAANSAASNANTKAAAANTAATDANNAVTNINSIVDTAAQEATAAAEARIDAAIEAVGDISEQAIPLMSSDVRGGAKLDDRGGLALRDGALGIGDLVQESDGEVRGPIAALTAEGWAEQDSTTGKNLLDSSSYAGTQSGVTFVVNTDGSVTCNGTATATINRAITFTAQDGVYALSGCPSNGGASSYQIWIAYSSGGAAGIEDTGSGASGSLTAGDYVARIRIANGYTCNNLTFYPQLELGSTATEYEPYTGGAPSPSPDYPQEIRVARGRNLFDSSIDYTLSGNVNEGMCLISGGTTFYTRIAKHTDYYIQSFSYGGVRFRIVLFENEPSTTPQTANPLSDTTTVTTPSGMAFNSSKYEWVALTLHNTTYIPTMKAQLTLGSTPQPYVPYGYVGLEVAHNLTLYSADHTVDGSGNYAVGSVHDVMSITLENGSYYLSYNKTTFDGITRVHAYDANGNWVKQLAAYSSSKAEHIQCQFTVDSSVHEVRVSVPKEFTNLSIISVTPIPLPSRGWVGSLPDGTADKLTLTGAGKVTWEKNTEEIVFDGSESGWRLSTQGLAITTFEHKNVSQTQIANALSDQFIAYAAVNLTTEIAGFCYGNSNNNIIFSMGTGPIVLSDWLTHLSAHPLTILYQLATPITEEAGYIDLPDIPSDATVSIPELDALNIEYFIDNSVTKLISQWKERLDSIDLADIEDAIADLSQYVADKTKFYFDYETSGGTKYLTLYERS